MTKAIAYHEMEMRHTEEDILELKKHIELTKMKLEACQKKYDAIAADAAQRTTKLDHLTVDEEAVRIQEREALHGRFKLQRRLSDVGGHENTLKVLIATLAATKEEVAEVRQKKIALIVSQKELEKEHAILSQAINKAKTNIEAYAQDRSAMDIKKREVEAKLAKIAAFLTSH